MGQPGEAVGRSRGYHQRMSTLGQGNVSNVGIVVASPVRRIDGLPGKRLKGQRLDEARRRLGHDNLDRGAKLLQATQHQNRLVGADTSGDAQSDVLGHGKVRLLPGASTCRKTIA